MTILITGSRGKTSSQLLPILSSHPNHNASEPLLLTSRHPEIPIPNQTHRPVVKLNYFFPETFSNPFCHDALDTQRKQQQQQHDDSLVEKKDDEEGLGDVKAMYLVGIDRVYDASEKIVPFVRLARESGVKRIVVLSAWEVERGEARMMGGVHEEVAGGGGGGDCEEGGRMVWPEWVVVRPHFFMENFKEGYHLHTIKHENRIYSAAQDGKVAFISAFDIANVATHALLDDDKRKLNKDYIITGREALDYDEVAAIFTKILGRRIIHVRLSRNAFENFLRERGGLEPDFANYMADLDVRVARGEGARITNEVKKVTGKQPKSLEEWVGEFREVWC
ncbi:NAD(P)-binding protein [Sphaerulina musiva SO2202]|uniref:NAD(P)-binding protein n=1 Tax=Sphaerulina musiva (strain SO2202) TaxID=692275 RepID=M3C8F1_SPHMS|nr:NAD(P)-binding protein [Sphaerulina musiva SO2202]EMF08170.1 NAD(P)-binding protein [Sphaerulina musiva SO2202]